MEQQPHNLPPLPPWTPEMLDALRIRFERMSRREGVVTLCRIFLEDATIRREALQRARELHPAESFADPEHDPIRRYARTLETALIAAHDLLLSDRDANTPGLLDLVAKMKLAGYPANTTEAMAAGIIKQRGWRAPTTITAPRGFN
jgi:hypothetical protein